MEILIKLNNQTAGRDKIARLAQYFSRLVWYRFEQQQKHGVHRLKNLEYQLSTFRKLLNLGSCVDSIYAALAIYQHPNQTVRFTVILSKISIAVYWLADHILWLGRVGLCSVNADRWSRISNKYWLYSIVMNLIRDFYEILQVLKSESTRIAPKASSKNLIDVFKSNGKAIVCILEHRDVMVDTVKNCCDFFIPLSLLGHVTLSPGTIGVLGMISSGAGLLALIKPYAKLTPS